ncbi:LexA family transcriptional regulator [Halomonas venusta]|uniref:LexA family protein n=1 Tax=Vreelandella venusta TaxID=44935 RepID=UPI00295F246D|nr:LexA family transcriptional regulator [Halomonas venusta]MDW0360853.1 LexA family transcriptional regulator [Halomonas venusta]
MKLVSNRGGNVAGTIGSRIKEARIRAEMTQPQLAKACGWSSQGRVSNYERDLREPKSGDIAAIAKALNVSESWIWTGDGGHQKSEDSNVRVVRQPDSHYRYPVISWVKAGNWAEALNPFSPGCEDRYQMTDYRAKGDAFWLEVKGDSMTASVGESVPQGMMILVDTGIEAENGSLVVAQIDDSEEATFKKLVIDGGQRYLKPLNPAYPVLDCQKAGCRILGVAVEMKRSLR